MATERTKGYWDAGGERLGQQGRIERTEGKNKTQEQEEMEGKGV